MSNTLKTYGEDAKGRIRLAGNEETYTTPEDFRDFLESVREDFSSRPLAA
ncbi:MAG: hypothetical protein IKU04_05630 [Bacteroidales bacterium]|nr:hypothetical protein [Bacteroidales bacterium]